MSRSPRLPLLVLLLLSTPAAGATEEGPRLTLSASVERALAAHPSLAAARARWEAALATVGEAEATGRPVARLLATGTRYGEPVPVTPIHGFGPADFPPFDDTLVQGSLSLRTTLYDSGARRARIRQTEADAAATRDALAALADGIVARVASAYATVQARRDLVAAARLRTEAVTAEAARIGELLAVGRAPEVERLRAEAALASAEADASRAATALDSAERDLARLAGLDVAACRASRLAPLGLGESRLAPSGGAPPLEVERARLQAEAVAASPEVTRAHRQVAAAEATRALARSAYFPTLEAVGALHELGDAGLSFATEWNAGLQLSVPLWDGGMTRRRVARADALLAEARARLSEAELAAREAVDRALAAAADARARAAALARAEERLVEVAHVQQLLLEVGAGTQIDYLAAEAELASTRAARVEARTLALLAEIELARATGALSPDWIARLETRP